jgi:hypothetical protein
MKQLLIGRGTYQSISHISVILSINVNHKLTLSVSILSRKSKQTLMKASALSSLINFNLLQLVKLKILLSIKQCASRSLRNQVEIHHSKTLSNSKYKHYFADKISLNITAIKGTNSLLASLFPIY